MSANRLLFEIVRGVWCIDVSNIYAYAPVVQNILKGENVYAPKQPITNLMSFYDSEGRKVKRDSFQEGFAQIDLVGELTLYGGLCTYGAKDYVEQLEAANNNPNVKGSLLYIDGPGGSVSSINPFREFKSKKKKAVVGVVNSACSAHAWAMFEVCDYIIALDPISGRFGSVGVMCTLADVKAFYEAKGYKLHEIYADESSDKNLSFRKALEGKYEMIKEEELSPIAKKFQNAVRAARPNLKDKPGVLTGKTFFAEEAKEIGFIDAVGSIEDAFAMIEIINSTKYLNHV